MSKAIQGRPARRRPSAEGAREEARLKPLPSPWLRLVEPYRNGDWFECIEILRPLVEEQPDDLGTRLLFGTLCLATDQAARALVQFEKILPLAVGQGDLYRALGAQKLLDRLRPAATHDKRFVAIHQWFSAVRRRRADSKSAGISRAVLLELPPAAFHRIAEACSIEEPGLEARDHGDSSDAVRVVLYGRVRWSVVPEGEPSMLEAVANPLDIVALAPELPARTRLRLAPELPSAFLRFDLALLRAERENAATPRAAGHRKTPSTRAPAGSGAGDAAGEAAHTARPSFERPVPDPVLEPTVAVSAPSDRRRETRVSLTFDTRVALLGVAGSRVAPFAGRLVNLSPSGVGLAFPRAELLPVRDALDGTMLTVEIALSDGEPPLRLVSRVRWVQLPEPRSGGATEESGVMGLEFILVGVRDHARIQRALIAAARTGEPLDAAPPDAAAA